MAFFLKNLLILLIFSVITVSAQDLAVDTNCNESLNACLDKCSDADEECMDKCDVKYSCPEVDVEVTSEL